MEVGEALRNNWDDSDASACLEFNRLMMQQLGLGTAALEIEREAGLPSDQT